MGALVRARVQGRGATVYSGQLENPAWKIEFEAQGKWENPLTGWTSTSDPLENVNRSHAMVFQTKEDAIAFCDKHGIEWSVREPNLPDKVRRGRYKQYGDNYGLMGGHRFKGGPPTYDKCLTYGDKSGFGHVKGFDHLEYKAPAKKGGKKKA